MGRHVGPLIVFDAFFIGSALLSLSELCLLTVYSCRIAMHDINAYSRIPMNITYQDFILPSWQIIYLSFR